MRNCNFSISTYINNRIKIKKMKRERREDLKTTTTRTKKQTRRRTKRKNEERSKILFLRINNYNIYFKLNAHRSKEVKPLVPYNNTAFISYLSYRTIVNYSLNI